MSTTRIVFLFLIVLSVSAWSQLSVQNRSGEEVMTVDDHANVTIGSSVHDGHLTTHTITIKEGAANGRVLKSNASGEAGWGTLPLNAVLNAGNDADGNDAVNFGRLGIGVSSPDSRVRVEGYASSSIPAWGTMNTSIYAKDVDSGNNETSVSIIGIGKVLTLDYDDAHVGVQGLLVGGGSNNVWMASAALAHHDLSGNINRLSGVSTTVKNVGSYPHQTNLKTFAFRGINENTGSDDWGILVEAHQNYLGGLTYVDNLFANGNVSASSFTDRTPYPKDLQTAYESVLSMQRLPKGKYLSEDKAHQLDHSKLHSFIQSADGEQRDLSATVSAQNEVIKDLITKNRDLESMNQELEHRLERLEALLDVGRAE
jgi:hypothetical protein